MPPGTRNALVPPSPNYLRDAGELTGGLLRGSSTALMGGLQMRDQLALDAYRSQQAGSLQGVYADAWRAAQEAAANPSMITDAVGNSLRGMWNRAKSSPAGLGEVIGENIDPRNLLKPRKALRQELDVYHGTPHTFDPETGAPLGRFRSEKIGTGEGQQVYGYGLYFAENPDVAGQYRQIAGHQGPFNAFLVPDAALPELNELSYQASRSGNDIASNVYSELATGDFGPEQLLRKASKEDLPAVREALANAQKLFAKHQGSRYKVDLPDAKIEQMMDWDKPLSQQSPYIRDALKPITNKLDREIKQNGGKPRDYTGWEIYQHLNETWADRLDRRGISYEEMPSSKAVALKLQRLGIPGVKFLDQGSRGVGQGTRNFVVFPGEEQHLNILSRD